MPKYSGAPIPRRPTSCWRERCYVAPVIARHSCLRGATPACLGLSTLPVPHFESPPPTTIGVVKYASRAYTRVVAATFDPEKNAINLEKHGISLSEGDGILNDPLALTIEDASAEGEQRFVTVGMNAFETLMVVVWTPRGDEIRMISVRKAEPKERRTYEKGI